MPSSAGLVDLNKTKLHLGDFAQRYCPEATPFGQVFSYYVTAVTLSAEERADFLEEPIAALPPAVLETIQHAVILFVPYIEKPPAPKKLSKRQMEEKEKPFDPADCLVTMDAPDPAMRLPVAYLTPRTPEDPHVLAFGIEDVDSSEFHYSFFYTLACILFLTDPQPALNGYSSILREELKVKAHGEVDEPSWKAKLELLNKESGTRGETKLFRQYAHNSFIDTMTLFLHGICCDIDVEPGPRQIASRYLRKRLQYLQKQYPQPDGYAVFPEELKN